MVKKADAAGEQEEKVVIVSGDDEPGSDQVDDDAGDESGSEEEPGAAAEEEGTGAGAAASQADEQHEEEVVITIGDDEPVNEDDAPPDLPPKAAKKWAEMRIQLRDARRAQKALEAQVKAPTAAPAAQAPPVLGPEPDMSDEGIDYDPEKFKAAYTAWLTQRQAIEDAKAKKQREQDDAQAAWKARLDGYGKAKAGLKVRDFDVAEDAVRDTFSVMQQGIILSGLEAKDAATLVYAVGKNPKRAQAMAAITDPVKFAIAVGELRTQLKVTTAAGRTPPPPPERVIRSTVPGAASVDNELARLRAEAEKTGNYDKVTAYRRAQREKAQA